MREAPGWLAEEARAVWDGLDHDQLGEADVDALSVYCCAVADYRRAQGTLDQTGVVVRGARGGLVRNPLVMIRAEAAATIRTLGRQLGLAGAAPEEVRQGWRNQAGVERSITALRRGGRLEEVDAAAVALARHLAGALDQLDPARHPAQTASLARVQLATLRTLRGIDDDDSASPAVDDLLAFLSAPVGDATEP